MPLFFSFLKVNNNHLLSLLAQFSLFGVVIAMHENHGTIQPRLFILFEVKADHKCSRNYRTYKNVITFTSME